MKRRESAEKLAKNRTSRQAALVIFTQNPLGRFYAENHEERRFQPGLLRDFDAFAPFPEPAPLRIFTKRGAIKGPHVPWKFDATRASSRIGREEWCENNTSGVDPE